MAGEVGKVREWNEVDSYDRKCAYGFIFLWAGMFALVGWGAFGIMGAIVVSLIGTTAIALMGIRILTGPNWAFQK